MRWNSGLYYALIATSVRLHHYHTVNALANRPFIGLVLFYCAFVALRSEDAGDPLRRIDDHELHGEKGVYAGYDICLAIAMPWLISS